MKKDCNHFNVTYVFTYEPFNVFYVFFKLGNLIMKTLTVFEETVLFAIYRLGEQAYSVDIHQKILEMTGKNVIIGSLYNALSQLLKKGYLNKQKGAPVSAQGGKSKMYYKISKIGLKAMQETRDMHEKLWNEIPHVIYKES